MYHPIRTNYLQEQSIWPDSPVYKVFYGIILTLGLLSPLFVDEYYLGELAQYFIYCCIGISLILLTGYGGMLSLGHASLLAVGAYCHSFLLAQNVPFFLSVLCTLIFSGLVGFLLSFPLRHLKGVYLSIATLAMAVLVQELAARWESVTGGLRGLLVPTGNFFQFSTDNPNHLYYLSLFVLGLVFLFV